MDATLKKDASSTSVLMEVQDADDDDDERPAYQHVDEPSHPAHTTTPDSDPHCDPDPGSPDLN